MLSASLLLAAAAGVTAASGNASGNPAREAATDAASLDVITVEASKRPIAVGDIASRVTVIDDVRIERELAQSIHDLVRYEPGVDVVDQGSRFGYAGFNIRGVGGNRVHVEVDGVEPLVRRPRPVEGQHPCIDVREQPGHVREVGRIAEQELRVDARALEQRVERRHLARPPPRSAPSSPPKRR